MRAVLSLPYEPLPCLACRPEWNCDDHVEGNYQRAGLVVDANAGYGRNKRRDVLKEKVRGDGGPMNLLLWAIPAVVLPSWGWPMASCPAPTALPQSAALHLANGLQP